MKLNKWQILLGIGLTVIGTGLQFYTELPIGKIGMAVWVIVMVYGMGFFMGNAEVALPFSQLNQATTIEQLPRFSLELSTANTSLSLLVFMGLCLPSLWLASFFLLKAYHDASIFSLLVSAVVLGFAVLSLLATFSEMLKNTLPTPHGSITVSPEHLRIDERGQVYQVTWHEVRDIIASGSDSPDSIGRKRIVFVLSIAGELREITLYQADIPADTRKLAEFLSDYRVKAQGRNVVRIT